jgi:hypothetical protein
MIPLIGLLVLNLFSFARTRVSFLVDVESFLAVVESFLVEVELSCWTEWLVSHLSSVASV